MTCVVFRIVFEFNIPHNCCGKVCYDDFKTYKQFPIIVSRIVKLFRYTLISSDCKSQSSRSDLSAQVGGTDHQQASRCTQSPHARSWLNSHRDSSAVSLTPPLSLISRAATRQPILCIYQDTGLKCCLNIDGRCHLGVN